MENTVTLNNDVEMPKISYGVYQIPSVVTERCVTDALNVGYCSVDTAQCYGNEKQVSLRFLYQQDIVIIPKSTHIERMRENLDILDFELTENEMNALYELDLGKSMFGWW